MKKVLIVEDEQSFNCYYRGRLSERVNLTIIDNLKDVEDFINKNPDIDLITMDGNIIGGTTVALVRKIRATFKGLIVATSFNPDLQKELLSAGCDYKVDKADLPKAVVRLLDLPA